MIKKSEEPFFFQKPCDAAIHVNQSLPISEGGTTKYHGISYPSMTNNLHYEAELVVAIGSEDFRKNNKNVQSFTSHQDKLTVAENMIYGYAVGCDLTRRDLQAEAKIMSRPWDTSKGFDQSAPMTSIVPKEHLGSLDNFSSTTELKLWINEELKQSSRLSDMIWSIPEIIVHLSRYFQLVPGDLIMTGTPAGVGTLRTGDRVRSQCGDLLPECKFEMVP
jgi:fumarylpyruvate hydrolase